jgi:hypothetical protein
MRCGQASGRAAWAVAAFLVVAGLTPQLRGQTCGPENPCLCTECCENIVAEGFYCQDGSFCAFTICQGGPNDDIEVAVECLQCCGGQSNVTDTYQIGNCNITSPAKGETSANPAGTIPAYVFVRTCDGEYSLVRLAVAG